MLLAVLVTYRDGIGPMLLEPAWAGVTDPIDRVFALLDRYRDLLAATDCLYGCPIGSLALETHEPDPAVGELLAANFDGWAQAVQTCYDEVRGRLPDGTDTRELAIFTLTVMEGGVMQARTQRSLDPFDAGVRRLRAYLSRLLSRPSPS